MGVQGLLGYILQNTEASNSLELVDLAKKRNVIILCDFQNLAITLSHKVLQQQRRLPESCRFYGGDLKPLVIQMEKFVDAMKHLDIEVIYIEDVAFGADEEDFTMRLQRKIGRSKGRLTNLSKLEGGRFCDAFAHQLVKESCRKVLIDKGAKLITSVMEADQWIINNFSTCKAFAVLSTDTDFVVSHSCDVIPIEEKFFKMEGFHEGDIKVHPSELPCKLVNRSIVADSLRIDAAQLPHLAVLCGNDCTKEYTLWDYLDIDSSHNVSFRDRVSLIADWLKSKCFATREEICMDIVRNYDALMKSTPLKIDDIVRMYDYSIEMYEGNIELSPKLNQSAFPSQAVQKHLMPKKFLAIENGRFWLEVVSEPEAYRGTVHAHHLAKPLRQTLYALCGCDSVIESGAICIENRTTIVEPCKTTNSVAIQSSVFPLQDAPTKVAFLCYFVSKLGISGQEHKSIVRDAVLIAILGYVLQLDIFDNEHEKQMFILSIAACSLDGHSDGSVLEKLHGSFPRRLSSFPPNMKRSAHLSAIVVATLPVIYDITGILGIWDLAPNVAHIFSQAIFVHMMMKCLQRDFNSAIVKLGRFRMNSAVQEAFDSPSSKRLRNFADVFRSVVQLAKDELNKLTP